MSDHDTIFDDDKLKEECGIFGIYNHPEASALTALGLHALQHRGQEATGIVSYDGSTYYAHRAIGLVDKAFGRQSTVASLKGSCAIGHNRYATTGASSERNIQPLFADLNFGGFSLAHNGNLTNAETLRQGLVDQGSIFQSTTDTEVIIHLMATARGHSVPDRMIEALKKIKGAYAIVALYDGAMVGVRDPHGVRPLVLGELNGTKILASETCALDIIGASYVRDIAPGEMVVITEKGLQSLRPFAPTAPRFCVFEYIYFARPDSSMEGRSVYTTRKAIGAELAREAPAPTGQLVVPVPDSGVPAAMGFAEASGIPFEYGIIRNHYVGRTFIQPTQAVRNLGVKMKHNANRALIEGKSVVLVDDSIVRGTTSKKIVEMLRAAGAREVHMRISSPPTAHSCFYGIDTPSTKELLAHTHTLEQIRSFIGVDTLAYISVDGLHRAVVNAPRDNTKPQFCDACFTGIYPIEIVDHNTCTTGASVKRAVLERIGAAE